MSVLTVKELRKSYKKGFIPRRREVLKGVSFSLQPGTITGFLGANGAGKTTTMKCVLGLAHPDSGEATFFGGLPLSLETKNRIGFLPERPYFYEYLTGEEFLRFYGQLSGRFKRTDLEERINKLLLSVGLEEARHRRLRAYSKGMLQKIGFAQAIIHNPDLVILDEPVSGLDPDGRMAIAELIKKVASEGAAVFFSSHLMFDTEKLCQNLVIMRDGVIIYEGATDKFLDSMGSTIEVTVQTAQGRTTKTGLTLPASQQEIRNYINNGAQIIEVRHLRTSLEEAFVKVALRGQEK